MADDSRWRLAALIAAKMVCCGGLIVLAAGGFGLGGLAGWLLEGGFWWLLLAAVAAAISFTSAGVTAMAVARWAPRRHQMNPLPRPANPGAAERCNRCEVAGGEGVRPGLIQFNRLQRLSQLGHHLGHRSIAAWLPG